MRYHHLVLSAVAVLATNSFTGNKGFVLAETPEETEATPQSYSPPANSESFEYEADVSRMLDIVVNSLYQKKDVFLRELISNASDAIDKIRFLAIEDPSLLSTKAELEIRITYDESEKSVTISDSGIGMTKDDLIKNLGTVARSGTGKFLEAMKDSGDIGMIGQFGVGFYSAFLVADRVRVASKSNDDEVQYVWESLNGDGAFSIYEDPRGVTLGRGTEITVYFKEDSLEYVDAGKLKELVGFYSEFVTHPIHVRTTKTMQVPVEKEEDEDIEEKKGESDEDSEDKDDEEGEDDEDDEDDAEGEVVLTDDSEEEKVEKEPEMEEVTTYSWEQMNANKPLWNRDKDEISDDEYQSFYKVISKDTANATSWNHFSAEGNINFKSLVYLPSEAPQGMENSLTASETVHGLKLYVRKVLISDTFELLPRYLSLFVTGVVDSDDLPLNVNRESLQESKLLGIIKKKVTRKVIETITKLSKQKIEDETDSEDGEEEDDEEEKEVVTPKEHPYITWYKKFKTNIKMGILDDDSNRDKLIKLLRFKTSNGFGENDFSTVAEYVERMPEWQTDIYFYAGTSVEEANNSEFIEIFKEKDIEVIYFVDTIDEYMVSRGMSHDSKKFVSITRGNLKFKDEDKQIMDRREKVYRTTFKPLTKFLKNLLLNLDEKGNTSVSISKRLVNSPAIITTAEYGSSANMERLVRAQAFQHGANEPEVFSQRVLEINPRHPFVIELLRKVTPEGVDEDDFEADQETTDLAMMLYDMATLNSGFLLSSSKSYGERMNRVLQVQMGLESMELADEIDPPVEEDEPPEGDEEAEGMNMLDFDDFDLGDM